MVRKGCLCPPVLGLWFSPGGQRDHLTCKVKLWAHDRDKTCSIKEFPSAEAFTFEFAENNNIDIRAKMSCLIESPGCFPNYSVWNNLMLQATNLSIKNPEDEVRKVLKLVRMEGAAGNKYKNCSLGMKQRVGIAMALLGDPELLILDEPINGLDVDGMRIVREILLDLANNHNKTIVISSHILGELEKIATHYGIIRQGKMIKEMTSEEFEKECRTFIALRSKDLKETRMVLNSKYSRVEIDEAGYIRIYDNTTTKEVVTYLYNHNIIVNEIRTDKVGLEEYYIDLMNEKGGN